MQSWKSLSLHNNNFTCNSIIAFNALSLDDRKLCKLRLTWLQILCENRTDFVLNSQINQLYKVQNLQHSK